MTRPTRAGTALVPAVTVVVLAWLVLTVGFAWPVAVGGGGTLLFAAVVQAQHRDRYRPVVGVLTAAALPVVGGALVVSTGDVLADQIRAAAPPGAAPFVGSVLLALFGAATTLGDDLGRTPLVRALGIALRAFLVLAGSVAALAVVRFTAVGAWLAALLTTARLVVFAPPPGVVALGSLLALVALAVGGVAAALRALPVAELLDERRERVDGASRAFVVALAVFGVTALVVVVLETTGDPYTGLPSGLRFGLATLTGATSLRWALVLVALATLSPASVARALKRGYRADPHGILSGAAPYLGAGLVVAVTLLASGGLVARLRSGLRARVPDVAEPAFRDLAAEVVSVYGDPLLALAVVLVVLAVATVVLGLLLVAVLASFVPGRAGGPVLAGSGVFGAAAFAVVLGAPLWTGLAGAVAAMVLRDAGSFAVTLTRELEGAASARTELLHAGASTGVGALTGVVGLALTWSVGGLAVDSAVAVAALVAALLGGALLVVASR